MNLEQLQSEWEKLVMEDRPSWLAYKDDNAHRLDNYDPAPWCHQCGARTASQCDCGPIADNN